MQAVNCAFDPEDDVLDSQLVCSSEEVVTEFWECCERARFCGGRVPVELQRAAKALARMLERSSRSLIAQG